MNRYLFLKVDEVKKAHKDSRRSIDVPSMDPKLLHLLTARYV